MPPPCWINLRPVLDLPCSDAQLNALRGTIIYVPLFDCQTNAPGVVVISTTNCSSGLGANNYYRISGFAPFYFAGWFLASTNMNRVNRTKATIAISKVSARCNGLLSTP